MTLEEARDHIGETVLYSSVPGECEAGGPCSDCPLRP